MSAFAPYGHMDGWGKRLPYPCPPAVAATDTERARLITRCLDTPTGYERLLQREKKLRPVDETRGWKPASAMRSGETTKSAPAKGLPKPNCDSADVVADGWDWQRPALGTELCPRPDGTEYLRSGKGKEEALLPRTVTVGRLAPFVEALATELQCVVALRAVALWHTTYLCETEAMVSEMRQRLQRGAKAAGGAGSAATVFLRKLGSLRQALRDTRTSISVMVQCETLPENWRAVHIKLQPSATRLLGLVNGMRTHWPRVLRVAAAAADVWKDAMAEEWNGPKPKLRPFCLPALNPSNTAARF
eukprot:TRINITY_DN11285_c0_g1_i2.p1 TRINITY_DN11285_c0_g1~~TRINITY_DN11285_c0_g1_i2.p1  ORF type:complete len:324 (+),score=34.93 TRINITY_DN11285_c0_g1_i2:66-974(+)